MNSTAKVHVIYIVGILITIIIVLLAFRFSDVPKIPEYLSVAGNLTSLVLAILAIVYAYFSNFSLTETLARFSGISGRITDAANEVAVSAAGAKDSSIELATRTTQIVEVTTVLSKTMVELSEMTRSVADSTQALQTRIETFPGMFQSLGEKIDQTQSLLKSAPDVREAPSEPSVKHDETSGKIISDPSFGKYFLRSISLVGLYTVCACVLSKQSGKAITVDQLEGFLGINSAEYMGGFWACLKTVGMASSNKNEYRNISVTMINPGLEAGAKPTLLNLLNTKKWEGTRAQYIEALEKLESYMK